MRLAIPLIAVLVAGCSDSRTVNYFKQHTKEMERVLWDCSLRRETGHVCEVAEDAFNELRKDEDKKAAAQMREMRKKLLGTTGE